MAGPESQDAKGIREPLWGGGMRQADTDKNSAKEARGWSLWLPSFGGGVLCVKTETGKTFREGEEIELKRLKQSGTPFQNANPMYRN